MTNPKVKMAFTKSGLPILFAQIGKDKEAMEVLCAATVLAAVSVTQIMEAGPSNERRAMLINECLEIVANNVMDETTMVQ